MTPGSKQRIIGAFVLFALALIFFPLLFDLSGDMPLDTSAKIPAMPEIEPEVVPEPEPVEEVIAPEPEETFFQPAVEPTPEESRDPAPPALNKEGVPDAWVIQVGSFSERTKAESLSNRLKQDGHKSYVEPVKLSQGQMYRVFIGPNILKKDALDVQQRVEEKYRVQTILRKIEP